MPGKNGRSFPALTRRRAMRFSRSSSLTERARRAGVNSEVRSAPRVVGSEVAMSKYRCLTRKVGFGVRGRWEEPYHATDNSVALGGQRTVYLSYKLSPLEVFAHGFHLGQGVLVAGAVGGGDAFVEAGQGFFGAALFCEGLGGHLVGGDVVGGVLDEGGELRE